jgi:hypothetical protein
MYSGENKPSGISGESSDLLQRQQEQLAAQLRKPLHYEQSAPRSVAVIFVHGINTNEIGYSWNLRDKVAKRLEEWSRFIEWREVIWAQNIRDNQNNYMLTSQTLGALREQKGWFWSQRAAARRFIVGGLSDAAAYHPGDAGNTNAYFSIQREVVKAIESASSGNEPNRLLVFVGHSFGCQIISTFTWDTSRLCQRILDGTATPEDLRNLANFLPPKDNPTGSTATETLTNNRFNALHFGLLRTLAGMITFGNNMPLFTFKLPSDEVVPTAFPGQRIPSDIVPQWLNFVDFKDVLGFPLRTLNRRYEGVVAEDISVRNNGRQIGIRHHTGYWNNPTIDHALSLMLLHLIHPELTLDVARKIRPPSPVEGGIGGPIPMSERERKAWDHRRNVLYNRDAARDPVWPIYGPEARERYFAAATKGTRSGETSKREV